MSANTRVKSFLVSVCKIQLNERLWYVNTLLSASLLSEDARKYRGPASNVRCMLPAHALHAISSYSRGAQIIQSGEDSEQTVIL
jgi:hypothetical protein